MQVGGEGCRGGAPCPTWGCALAPAPSPLGARGVRGKSEGGWQLLSSFQHTAQSRAELAQSGSQQQHFKGRV